MRRFITLLVSITILFSAHASAEESLPVDLGPAVGQSLPHDLSVGEAPGFDALQGKNGAAIYFVRSVDWCPYCKAQVIETSESYAAFEELGLEVIYVSYDAAEKQARFAEEREIKGRFIADTNSAVIKAFGLLNEMHAPGSRAYGIPHPAVFIADETGTIRAKLYEEDYLSDDKSYRDRPATEIILQEARNALDGDS